MRKIFALSAVLLFVVSTQVHAKFTQQAQPCPSGQYTCEVDGFKWCCDNNPETSGGCVFAQPGNRGCCAGMNQGDFNCGKVDVSP